MGAVNMSAFRSLLDVSSGVIAHEAHELGSVLARQVLANGDVDEGLQGLCEKIVILAIKIEVELTTLIVELLQEFQFLRSNGLALRAAHLRFHALPANVLAIFEEIPIRLLVEISIQKLLNVVNVKLRVLALRW